MEKEETLDRCDVSVIGEDHEEACIPSWGQESYPAMFTLLQSPPAFTITSKDHLDLNDLGLD